MKRKRFLCVVTVFWFQGPCVSCSKVKLSQCSSGILTVRHLTVRFSVGLVKCLTRLLF